MHISENKHINTFIEYLRFEKRYSQHTVVSYQTDLEQFFAYLRSQFEIDDPAAVKAVLVRSWLAELKEDEMSAKSLNRKISTLKSFFKYLVRLELIEQTPMTTITSPKISKRLPQFVAEADMQKLMDLTTGGDDWKTITDHLLLRVFYATGMRLSELINLKISQVDIHYKQLKVVGKGNKERIIPVNQELLTELTEYISVADNRSADVPNVFINLKGKPLYPKYVYKVVNDYLKDGITTIDKKSPHILRHSFATHLTNNGAQLNAIKELLGHSSLAATQVYTHNSIEKLKDAFRNAHPKA